MALLTAPPSLRLPPSLLHRPWAGPRPAAPVSWVCEKCLISVPLQTSSPCPRDPCAQQARRLRPRDRGERTHCPPGALHLLV